MKYWAFLSYSHTDKKWGDWLHKALETYRVPRRLVGKETRDGKVPERVFPIFRDREELPVSADLGSNINEALGESRYLIVICSPRSAQSRWVGEEIKTFKKLGREDRILALIVDGEPNASDGKPGFKVEDECFHEAVRYRWSADGELSEIRSEPIAADAREGKDGKTNAKLKLLAGLLGVNYDDLKQREQERRLRRARRLVAAAVALIGIFAALSVALFFNARAARRARDEARATLSRSDFLQALRSIDEGKDFDALAQLSRSLRFNPKNQAGFCRLTTLLTYRDYALPVFGLRLDADVLSAEFSSDGKRILTVSGIAGALANKVAKVWDVNTATLLMQPTEHIALAHFGPDGNRIVTASDDTAQVWDVGTGKPSSQPMRHGARISSVAFSPNGKRVVTASDDKTARVWDAISGAAVVESMKHDNGVESAQFSSDGERVLTKTGHELRVWDSESGRPLTDPIKTEGYVQLAEFSSHGKLILTILTPSGAWEAETSKPLPQLLPPDVHAESVQVSPDGKYVVTESGVWERATGELLNDVIKAGGWIAPVFSPDGNRVLTVVEQAEKTQAAQVWDVRSGRGLTESMKHDAPIRVAKFSPAGRHVLTASSDGSVVVWNVQMCRCLSEPMKHDGKVRSVQFSPEGNRIVTASADKTARIWDAATAEPLAQPMRHDLPVRSAQFSPDGKRIVTASFDYLTGRGWVIKTDRPLGQARVWDAQTGRPLAQPMANDQPVQSAQFSPDGMRVLTVRVAGSYPEAAQVWDPETGMPMTKEIAAGSAKFSPDGKRILTSHKNEARLWDARTGDPLTEPMKQGAGEGAKIQLAQFTPDMKRIVTVAVWGNTRVWDGQTAEPLSEPMKIPTNTSVDRAELDPRGKRVAVAMHWGTVQVWDLGSGRPTTESMANDGLVFALRFSADGGRILTTTEAAHGGRTRIWDAQTGKPLTDWLRSALVDSAEFSPDGKRMAITSGNEALVWDIAPVAKSSPEWLPRVADLVAGEHLNDQGVFEPLREDPAKILKDVKDRLNSEPANDDWSVWGRWFLADRSTRTISPFSKITVPEYIENRIKENTAESLDEAEQLAVGNAQLLERIARAKALLPPKAEQKEDEKEDNQ